MNVSKPQMICKKDKNGRSCYFDCDLYYGKKEYGRMTDSPLYKFTKERYEGWKFLLDEDTINKGEEYVIKNILLCQRHFEKCYKSHTKILTRNAVPTLHLEHQKSNMCKQKKVEGITINDSPVVLIQRRLMLDFVKKHPIIASEHYKDVEKRTELLKDMAYFLNTQGGAIKSPEHWLATWRRWKLGLNSKIICRAKCSRAGPSDGSLACLDQELLDFLRGLKEYGTAGSVGPAQGETVADENRPQICNNILEGAGKPNEFVPETTTPRIETSPGLPPEHPPEPGTSNNATKTKACYVRKACKTSSELHNNTESTPKKCREEELFCLRERENYVLKVYHYLESEYKYLNDKFGAFDELTPLGHILRRTANATGFTEKTVKKILEREMLRNAMADGRQKTTEARNEEEETYETEISSSAMELSDYGSNGGASPLSEEMMDEDSDCKVKLEFEKHTLEDIHSNEMGLKRTETVSVIPMVSNPETYIASNLVSDVTPNVKDSVAVPGNENVVKIEVVDNEINSAGVTGGDLGYQTTVTALESVITEQSLGSEKGVIDHQVTQDSLGYKKVTEQVGLKQESLDCEQRVTEKEQMFTEHKGMSVEHLGDSKPAPFEDILFCDESPLNIRIPSPCLDGDINAYDMKTLEIKENIHEITTNHHSPVNLTPDEMNPELHDDKISPWTPDIVKVESLLDKESREDTASDIPWRFN